MSSVRRLERVLNEMGPDRRSSRRPVRRRVGTSESRLRANRSRRQAGTSESRLRASRLRRGRLSRRVR